MSNPAQAISFRSVKQYKYQLTEDYSISVPIKPLKMIKTPFVRLTKAGKLTIKQGYSWDGASGPTWDLHAHRASLVHDALYQLMRMGLLDHVMYRPVADLLLRDIAREDGMSRFRSAYWHYFVSKYGGRAAEPQDCDDL